MSEVNPGATASPNRTIRFADEGLSTARSRESPSLLSEATRQELMGPQTPEIKSKASSKKSEGSAEDPNRLKFLIQVDKNTTMAKDVGVDTEAHLLFEDIADLYDPKTGEVDPRYRDMLQLNNNRGLQSNLKSLRQTETHAQIQRNRLFR